MSRGHLKVDATVGFILERLFLQHTLPLRELRSANFAQRTSLDTRELCSLTVVSKFNAKIRVCLSAAR